ncbi:16858_t:CDS:2 [Funneliformis caledonium]|uniref:16858_t:CDS:1 n=1 Tax=Funneliformis caledonium TaxID=1117310 RepID=A0A9N9G7A4_9GLOM|nr:16858_t:CDS:2 [Funneliformis caledonium]
MAQTPTWNTQQSESAFGVTFNLHETKCFVISTFETVGPFEQPNVGNDISSIFTPAPLIPQFGFGFTSASSGLETGLTDFYHSLLETTQGGLLTANITMETKFSELIEQDQNLITEIDQYIQNQKIIMSSIESTYLSNLYDYVNQVVNESRALFQKINAFENELQIAHNLIYDRLKDLEGQITIVEIGKRFYEAASQGLTDNILQLRDKEIINYYHDLLNSFEERLRQYSISIEEIDRHFSSLCQGSEIGSLAALNETLHWQHQCFMAVTGMVAKLHEEMDELRVNFEKVFSNTLEEQKDPSLLICKFSQIRFDDDII